MSKTLLFVIAVGLLMPIAVVHTQSPRGPEQKSLSIYYVDTEGGKAVLFVSSTGETLLYDTGTGGDGDRDLYRVMALIKASKLPLHQICHFIVLAYHRDHTPHTPGLSRKLPNPKRYRS